ncbi:hypothetical protein [uncultured Paludibaculum sp.]|uniref:hypothetical protein n=1 Tax=uncultured Paludibaculum sp. TaxID=1765020 RepID=UPI002AABA533|nr:hypothetical protein [uncultured Paludibaculum sp.]
MKGDELRRLFNAHFTPERYARFQSLIDGRSGTHVGFRLCETPCFFDWDFMQRISNEGRALIEQLVDDPEYRKISDASLPEKYRVPGEPHDPTFVQVDFGVVRGDDGLLHPKLVEIQGFPSLYAFQPVLAQSYLDAYELPGDLHYLLDGLDNPEYLTLLRQSIVGDHDPENVVLLEVDPEHQKTRCDFLLTERMLGVRAVCVTRITKRGAKLYYQRDGRDVEIRRIYNRAIVDEIERRQVPMPFDWRDDLDVEWAGHPNFYFRVSKFSIPYLRHPSVPQTLFLDQVREVPEDLSKWVLKPLYSFAGLGVVIGPSRADIDAISAAQRANFILQERVEFTPVVETPHGLTKAEIRVMYINRRPVTHIIRMGRGKMMGVDHNKNMEWVGASAALYHEES